VPQNRFVFFLLQIHLNFVSGDEVMTLPRFRWAFGFRFFFGAALGVTAQTPAQARMSSLATAGARRSRTSRPPPRPAPPPPTPLASMRRPESGERPFCRKPAGHLADKSPGDRSAATVSPFASVATHREEKRVANWSREAIRSPVALFSADRRKIGRSSVLRTFTVDQQPGAATGPRDS